MRKNVATALAFLIILECQGQKHESKDQLIAQPVDLRKYSYLLVITNGGDSMKGVGTAFFYRVNGRLLMITAKHIFTGFNYFFWSKNANTDDIAKVFVRHFDNDGKTVYFPLIIDKSKQSLDAARLGLEIDLSIWNFTSLEYAQNINSIEIFMDSYKDSGENELPIESYGFTFKDSLNQAFIDTVSTHAYFGKIKHIQRQRQEPKNTHYFVTDPGTDQGSSGGPVFTRYSNSNYAFAGMIVGGTPDRVQGVIVKPDVVIKEIRRVADALQQ